MFSADLPASPPGADDDYWYQPYGASDEISEDQAMRISAVYACTTLIAQSIAALPVSVMQRTASHEFEEAYNHPLNFVIQQSADSEWTATEFWEAFVGDIVRTGYAVSKLQFDSRRNVSGITRLSPSAVTPKVVDGVKFFEVRERGVAQVLRTSDAFDCYGNGYDGVRGYSPISMLARSFGLASNAEDYANRFFVNGATPPHYISFPAGSTFTEKGSENLLRWFRTKFGGVKNAHKLGILYNGGEIKSVPISHRDIQFLELRKFQVEEIARIYRVPLHMIGSLDRATFSNIEHQAIEFVKYTLLPWVRKIEARCSHCLLGPQERNRFAVRFDLDGLMRGDMMARAEYVAKLRTAGVIGGNEGREMEGFSPRPECEGVMIQGAMVPIEMAGQQQQKGAIAQ